MEAVVEEPGRRDVHLEVRGREPLTGGEEHSTLPDVGRQRAGAADLPLHEVLEVGHLRHVGGVAGVPDERQGGVVLQIGPDAGQVDSALHAHVPQVVGRPDPGQHEELWTVDRTAAEDHLATGMDGVLRSILLGGVYVAGVAVIGLSLGTLLRSAAAGIVVLVALFFLLEIATSLLGLVPGDFWKYVSQYIPSVAGGRMLEIGDKAAFISPLSGGLIFLAWIVVITVPAIVSFKNRDI